jgi:hypothetical protein
MKDFDDEDVPRRSVRKRTPNGRVYVHRRCGGHTKVSGGDYTHICDPFWPCTSTYCCQCSGFAPLSEVRWADTGETVAAYRRRVRSETPAMIQVWRYGVGLVPGGLAGAILGLLVALLTDAPNKSLAGFAIIGGLIGAFLIYLLGTILLNKAFDVDYRRMP